MLHKGYLDNIVQRVDDPRQRVVVVRGARGVGKTDLLRELSRVERARGVSVYETAGTARTRSEPFGALVHLLPEIDLSQDPTQILQDCHRTLNGTNGRRPLLVVDDAHLVDEWTAAFLSQCALTNSAFVVAAVVRGEPLPSAVSSLIYPSGSHLIDVSVPTETEVAALIRSILGGPVDTFAMVELIRLSGGNPGWVRRLVADARGRGALVLEDGVWQRTGELAHPVTASAIVGEFLASLTEDGIEVLDILAIAGTLDLTTLEKLVDLRTLEALEQAGLVRVDPVCPASSTSLGSVALEEMLVRRMPETRRVRLSRRLAAHVEVGTDAEGAPPAWMLVTERLDDPEQCERGARLALADGDFRLAERFASACIRLGGGATARVLRAEALLGLGDAAEARSILRDVATTAAEDALIAQAALAQMRHVRSLAGRPEDAFQIGEQALMKLGSPDWRDAISAELAHQAGVQGDYTRAASLGADVLTRPGASDRAVLEAAVVSSQAQIMLGRLTDALAAVHRGMQLAPRLATEMPMSQHLLEFSEFQVHLWSGSLEMAGSLSDDRLANALDRRVEGWVGLWTLSAAAVKLFKGEVLESAQGFCAALGNLKSFDPLRIVPVGQAWRALAESQAGMLRAAETTIARIDPEYLPGEFRVEALRRGVEAWIIAQASNTATAADLTREAGLELIDHTHVVWGCFLLHQAARFGHGESVAEDLIELASGIQSPLVEAMSTHAQALADRDTEMLRVVSRTFEEMGALLLAAEAAAQAAAALDGPSRSEAAARAALRASQLAGLVKSADTPALRQMNPFLTPREQGIARMAMQGMKSRAIAESLSISIRTVDNHLGSVYTKLGIHGREELASVLTGRL